MGFCFWINLFLTFWLGVSSGGLVWADDSGDDCSSVTDTTDAGQCTSLIKDCQDLGKNAEQDMSSAAAAAVSTAGSSGLQTGATNMGASYSANATAYTNKSAQCSKDKDQCESKCKDKPSDLSTCQKTLGKLISCFTKVATESQSAAAQYASSTAASSATPQSTTGAQTSSNTSGNGSSGSSSGGSSGSSSGGSSGIMSGISSMLPIAMMAGMMAMMMNKSSSSDTAATWNPNAALQANGTLDCSKTDAFFWNDCVTYLDNTCEKEVAASTYLTDQNCLNYSSRYCDSNTSGVPLETSATEPAALQPGSGVGTAYCQEILQVNFCQVSGRSSCPSCLQLQKIQSSICINNPAVCLGSSTAAATAAVGTSQCPATDPVYASSSTTSVASTTATATSTTTSNIVVPQSVTTKVAAGGSNATTMKVASDVADQSGTNVATYAGGSNATYAGGSNGTGSSVTTAYKVASVSAHDVASTASTVSTGPASDVEGAYGPNLFNVGSQVYRQHCVTNKLDNCP